MNFAERNRKFVEKMQALPENKKKIILWTIVVILAIIMGIFWIKSAANNFSRIGKDINIEIPILETKESVNEEETKN